MLQRIFEVHRQLPCSTDPKDAMENSIDDSSWGDDFNDQTSIDIHSNYELWNTMIFSGSGTLDPDSQSLANPSIDSLITTPQNVQNLASDNHELSYSLDNQTILPNNLGPPSYTLPLGDLDTDINKEMQELQDTLQGVKRELVTVKGQLQMAHLELYTIRSNHTKLLRWTLDMNETMKTLLKRLADRGRATTEGEQGFHMEDSGSWLNPGSEG